MKKSLIMVSLFVSIFFVSLYKYGVLVDVFIMPLQLLISVAFTIFSNNKREIILYNILLMVFTLMGIFINSYLYLHNVCYDYEGYLVMWLELLIAIVYIGTLLCIELLIKNKIFSFNINKIGKDVVFWMQVLFSTIPNLLVFYDNKFHNGIGPNLIRNLFYYPIIGHLSLTLVIMLFTYELMVIVNGKKNIGDFINNWIYISVFSTGF